MEPTSEQELKQLLDEGKITEEEYQELLKALRPKSYLGIPKKIFKLSRKQTMVSAMLMTMAFIFSLMTFLIGIQKNNFSILQLIFSILCGTCAILYWIAYGRSDEKHL